MSQILTLPIQLYWSFKEKKKYFLSNIVVIVVNYCETNRKDMKRTVADPLGFDAAM